MLIVFLLLTALLVYIIFDVRRGVGPKKYPVANGTALASKESARWQRLALLSFVMAVLGIRELVSPQALPSGGKFLWLARLAEELIGISGTASLLFFLSVVFWFWSFYAARKSALLKE